MINLRAGGYVNAAKVMGMVHRGMSGNPSSGGTAIVGPTKEAWYGQVHEFGMGKFPPRPFMRPALLNARHLFPILFAGLLYAKTPALRKAALVVEREAKGLLSAGGGVDGVPSPPGEPPHTQTGTLKNSISYEILI